MTRYQAGLLLEQIPYPSELELNEDIEYFLKKMTWETNKLSDYLSRPSRSHDEFSSEARLWNMSVSFFKYLQKVKLFSTSDSAE